jgi:hypothetical protein
MRRLATPEETRGLSARELRDLISSGVLPRMGGGAMELFRWTFPAIAASAIGAGAAVRWTASALERQVIPIASANLEPAGIALATCSFAGATPPFTAACPLVDAGNTIKVTAIGSVGVGGDVGVASTNGGLAPVSGASGAVVWRVGKAVSPADVGEVFSLYVSPRQLSGTP